MTDKQLNGNTITALCFIPAFGAAEVKHKETSVYPVSGSRFVSCECEAWYSNLIERPALKACG